MRRSLAKIPTPVIGNAPRHSFISSPTVFSTSAGGGGGAGSGRGRGSGVSDFRFSVGSTELDDNEDSKGKPTVPSGIGHGRGRGKPMASPPTSSSFSPSIFGVDSNLPPSGRGRGSSATIPPSPQQIQHAAPSKKPIFFFRKEDAAATVTSPQDSAPPIEPPTNLRDISSSIYSVLSSNGMGRGKPTEASAVGADKPKEENRHLRVKKTSGEKAASSSPASSSPKPRLSREEAVKRAVGILSRGGKVGPTFRGRDTGRGRGRYRGRGRSLRDADDADNEYGTGLYLGDDADGDRLAKRLGPDNMNKLVEAFEEMSGSVLPSPMEDAYLDALNTNFMIEFEPEYLMEEFGTNPDIDEKPPIPLREALEKMKPFLMVYEGIESQEEWEEVMKEIMERVPLLKEIVDYYSGPERVTAKVQQEELERVAKTVPESAPASVKRFAERAVLSLQSNPGWGFDKKCQFMDKMVREISQHYK